MKKIAIKSVRGSKTGRPIMVLLDLLGRRMALRVMWELSKSAEPMTFRDLQAAAETNPSVLNARLKELREARIISHEGEGYVLTKTGHSLSATLKPLHQWASAWARGTDD